MLIDPRSFERKTFYDRSLEGSFVPSYKYGFPLTLWDSVTPVLHCKKRYWRTLRQHGALDTPLARRRGLRQEVLVRYDEITERVFIMREVFHHVGVHGGKPWWTCDKRVRVIYANYRAIGRALQKQEDMFNKMFFVGFERGKQSEHAKSSSFILRGESEGSELLLAEARDRFLAAGQDFDRSNKALMALLEGSGSLPITRIRCPFPNPYVWNRWSDFRYHEKGVPKSYIPWDVKPTQHLFTKPTSMSLIRFYKTV